MSKIARTIVILTIGLGSAARAQAQASSGLLGQMSTLFTQQVATAPTPAGVGVVAHTGQFTDDPRTAATFLLVSQVSQQIGSQLTNFPLGSSAGGFTYGYDSELGTFQRTTDTFGPLFAERAATIGKGKASFGVSYLHAKYDSLDGKDLGSGAIKFDLFHQILNPPSYVQGDVIEADLKMNLTSDETAFLVNYGVTNRLDVGFAIPVVHVSMDLTYHATILDFATHNVSPTTHVFANGSKTQDFTSQGSASGVGDIVLRGKYNLGKSGRGVALGLDLRLPTGDKDNMLGEGSTQTRVFMIASAPVGSRVAPHLNVGYTFASGGTATDAVNYVGGVEYGISPKATIVGDFIGRTFRDSLRLTDVSSVHPFQQGPTAPTETTTLQSVGVVTGNLTSGLATLGLKVNPAGNLIISGNVLFPMNNAGLRTGVTPVIGFDYTF
jgi:hypothetical protein